MTKAICIIPARGGSKRIPHKNIKEFCGKPIIAYSIEAALKSDLFDRVMTSTDDEKIASIARRYGADVPFMRSAETSNDYATTADVLKEVLNNYACLDKSFDTICCLYPTAPFVRIDELLEAANMIEAGATSVIPVTSFDFPPLRGFMTRIDGTLTYAFPEYASVRSQDLPEMVHDCGRFYFAKAKAFEESGSFITKTTQALYIPPKFVQDIDTLEDWEVAEQKYIATTQQGEK
ncbi:pseudaminic acid cytidylyltransferase [Eggerthella sp. YY7918]|uniref:pseudaminic acid cytidylyltransferase n=1 Tax=Eggerthella sp. (strain YY7918) TaxID=502558 RepID=UPI0002171922|nr:pseudaminic acid cytidylyltransferase [Eggerthella sp. YY7918]BAK44096.1 CMP-N-acetylneuraminic acid synthetase [Eggerthella sp. YY7918]